MTVQPACSVYSSVHATERKCIIGLETIVSTPSQLNTCTHGFDKTVTLPCGLSEPSVAWTGEPALGQLVPDVKTIVCHVIRTETHIAWWVTWSDPLALGKNRRHTDAACFSPTVFHTYHVNIRGQRAAHNPPLQHTKGAHDTFGYSAHTWL